MTQNSTLNKPALFQYGKDRGVFRSDMPAHSPDTPSSPYTLSSILAFLGHLTHTYILSNTHTNTYTTHEYTQTEVVSLEPC